MSARSAPRTRRAARGAPRLHQADALGIGFPRDLGKGCPGVEGRRVSRRLPPEPVLWTDAVAEAAQADLSARLAQNVRAARAETGLSQERAAERAALSWIYWRQLEAGKSNPTLRVLAQVAVALGVEPGRLLLRSASADHAAAGRPTYPKPASSTPPVATPARPRAASSQAMPGAEEPPRSTSKSRSTAPKKLPAPSPLRRTTGGPTKKSVTARTRSR
jgi:transcriptional regulator with XRE-family HTH domain